MPLVTTGELIAQAQTAGHGLAACNVITLEHAEAVAAGAEAAGRPVVLQVSQNTVRFHGGRLEPISAACRSVAALADVPVSLHLDHVQDDELLRRAPAAGYSSVMVDAAHLPYADNLAVTGAAATWAHGAGLWLEAELGEVGGKDGAHAPWVRTDPAQALAFVEATGVDALAVAVGSSHAMTKPTARLDLDLVGRLRAAVPVPLVLHGSSGVLAAHLRRAVALGIVKVNIATAFNIAFTAAIRRHLAENPQIVDPRQYLSPAREAMADAVQLAVATVST
jgi:fructose-bisphosphate aldolase, class II